MRFLKQPAILATLPLLVLLLLCNRVGNIYGAMIHENNVDLHALLDFKQGITDPSKALGNWMNDTHFCRWNGVNCTDTRPFRVFSLALSGLNLGGQITPSLGNLTFLETLDLSNNSLVGSLPPLNQLQKLETLYLNDNFFQGNIPSEMGSLSNLQYLDLSSNSLVGPLPDFTNLQQLQYLALFKNYLQGIIPDTLTNCSNLSYIDLSNNFLMGAIPPKLGFLQKLSFINFKSNQLNGSIPEELGQLPTLQTLSLGLNRLSGELPLAILNRSTSLQVLSLEFNMLGKTLPPNIGDLLHLTWLTLGSNMFEGNIPSSLGNARGLTDIDLSNNNFTGPIPASLGMLSNLTFLNLQLNQLEARGHQDWEFLNALRNCRSLNFLSLSFNQLHGSIPQSVGSLSPSLEYLLLYGNNLLGQVPQSIGRLSHLTQLSLGGNNLSGTIEGWIENLKVLRLLNLDSSGFTGSIPSSIGNLTHLTYLYLSGNEFEGLIPDTMGNMPLLRLNLSYNNFQGYIPQNFGNLQDLTLLDLSHNNLQGGIPQVSNLKQLTTLDLSSNKLTGEIPDSLSQCYGLVSLQMDQNFLVGNIPINFGNLSMLSMLNLSHNNLSGTIPLSLDEIKSFIKLDLSYNHLQGEVPRNGVFRNATAVSLEGNLGLCGGAIDLHMPLCSNVSWRSETEYYLVRVLIPIFGFMSLMMVMYTLIVGKKRSQRTYLLLLSFGKKFPIVSYKDLDRATRNFSESTLVGRGIYGSVYVGKLTQAKIQVAIKVFDLDMECADKSFVTECDVLRSIRHHNLVPILTACSTIDNNGDAFKALVYEYIPNGNLDTWLHNKLCGDHSKCLSLVQRISIAIGIADALAYLHHDCERMIVHCDLKPTNILLDNDMNAYLGDFGIASLLGHSSQNTSTGLKGTIGYIAPEYAQSGQISSRGDVYSFGIVLLEMLVGRRPTDSIFENDINMVTFVKRSYPDQIMSITDAHLHGEFKDYIQEDVKMQDAAYGCLLSLMKVAFSCTLLVPRERMNMREVATKLCAIRSSYVEATRREQAILQYNFTYI